MNIACVTTYNNRLYNDYVFRFMESYKGKWDFDLFAYSEEDIQKVEPIKEVYNLFNEVPTCKEFVERNKHKPVNSFKEDGVRFCYKVYAYTDFLLNKSEGYDGVICIDADSVFYKKCNAEWMIENIHRDDMMMAFLGRGVNYSECGYLYFNMKHEFTKRYAGAVKEWYDEDKIYGMKEQHDSWQWDHIRRSAENRFGVKNHNIGDDGVGHVQARSVLAKLYDHCKGNRKVQGVSPENFNL